MGETSSPWLPFNFLGLPEGESRLETARVVVLPVPYDSTTSFKGGAREGPRAIVEASSNLEDYDSELDTDVAQVGIYTAPWLEPHMEGPQYMIERVRNAVYPFVQQGKLVALLGGEHSVSIGHVRALADRYADLSVLYLDAHADLRDEYMGTRWGHASVARRLSEICPVVQVGVRSLSQDEVEFIRGGGVKTFFWPPVDSTEERLQNSGSRRDGAPVSAAAPQIGKIVGSLSGTVYISTDLDVLDPAIMSAVGTPEPGGMDWNQVTALIRAAAERAHIVGFDVTELSPREGPSACAYVAAKLVYKLLAYSTLLPQSPNAYKMEGKSSAL